MASDTIDTLNKLIETCKDGEYGFGSSAEVVKNADLRHLFTRRAEECRKSAVELQVLVRSLGGEAEDSGTVMGATHRGWVAVKGTLSGYTDLAILEATENAEDMALEDYREALASGLPTEAQAVVERQFEGVKRNHAQVRMLRNEARGTAA